MTKLNKFEQHVIESALELWVAQFEKEITDLEAQGKRSIYHVTFPSMVAKDLKSKVESLTKKK